MFNKHNNLCSKNKKNCIKSVKKTKILSFIGIVFSLHVQKKYMQIWNYTSV